MFTKTYHSGNAVENRNINNNIALTLVKVGWTMYDTIRYDTIQ